MSKSTLGPQHGYVEMLDDASVKNHAKNNDANRKKYNPLRPSSAGHCTRELAYSLAEYHGLRPVTAEDLTAEQIRIFDLGHNVERHLIHQFERNLEGYSLKYKQQVVTFFPITAKNNPKLNYLVEGSIDTAFWSPDTHGVIDFKSKKDRFSQFYKTNWDETAEKLSNMKSVEAVSDKFYKVEDLKSFLAELNDSFFEHNFVQLNGYACTEFMRMRGVDHAAIIQSNKNDSRLREIRFKPSLELYDMIRAKFQTATDAVDNGDPELAPRDHILGSMKCKFCKFKADCWPGKNVDKAFYNTLPDKQWPKDTDRMGKVGFAIETLFDAYRAQSESEKARDLTERDILKVMLDAGHKKIRLSNGEVYEARQLKDGLVIRRTKV